MNKKYFKYVSYILVFCLCFFIALNGKLYAQDEISDVEKMTQNVEQNETTQSDNETQSVEKRDDISGIVDTKTQDGVYKYSENEVPYLPFIRYATDRILVDKEIGGTGVSVSAKSIEVTSKTDGIQVLLANDAVRINAPMEYVAIFGSNSVTIDSTINKAVLIYGCGEVTITENGKINGDLICYSTTLNINGEISGNVIGSANKVSVNGKVEKDLRMQIYEANINNENAIAGDLYLETYNKELKLDEKYNANIKYIDSNQQKITFQTVIDGIVTSLLFTLIYLIIVRKNNGKILDFGLNKTKENVLFVILSSVVFLVFLPIIFLVLLILSLVGLSAITVPFMIAIIAVFVIECLLSTFIVGSIIGRYMDVKYFRQKGLSSSILGAFIIYLVLYMLARVPFISGYVVMGLIILSTGITLTCMLKNKK